MTRSSPGITTTAVDVNLEFVALEPAQLNNLDGRQVVGVLKLVNRCKRNQYGWRTSLLGTWNWNAATHDVQRRVPTSTAKSKEEFLPIKDTSTWHRIRVSILQSKPQCMLEK